MNKKHQIFISSTYKDLIEERQSAVEAILEAGDIPAGMELFTAGNYDQMTIIRKWIDESDVFMLILGGRYGSIEENTQKSYTELEYQYAIDTNTPIFAIVLSDDFLQEKAKLSVSFVESIQNDKYQAFKSMVHSKMVSYADDIKDIKLSIHKALPNIKNTHNLSGWIAGKDILNPTEMIQRLNFLVQENQQLKEQLAQQKPSGDDKIERAIKRLESKTIRLPDEPSENFPNSFEGKKISLSDFLSLYSTRLIHAKQCEWIREPIDVFVYEEVMPYLVKHGLATIDTSRTMDMANPKPIQVIKPIRVNEDGLRVLTILEDRED